VGSRSLDPASGSNPPAVHVLRAAPGRVFGATANSGKVDSPDVERIATALQTE
jgi:hypothetical protein